MKPLHWERAEKPQAGVGGGRRGEGSVGGREGGWDEGKKLSKRFDATSSVALSPPRPPHQGVPELGVTKMFPVTRAKHLLSASSAPRV